MRLYWKHILKAAIPPRYPDWIPEGPVLKDRVSSRRAFEQVVSSGLPPHGDAPKNWDSLYALGKVLENTSHNGKVLDAGATLYSRILPWLYLFGYRDLTGINPIFGKTIRRGPIRYENGNVTATRFSDNTFDVITCLSVIEHGVDVEEYLRECFRILKPGGLLVTSTDYYATSIETAGMTAYGVPIHIFDKNEIIELLEKARQIGFSVPELDLNCEEKVVRWASYDLEYTFLVFKLKK